MEFTIWCDESVSKGKYYSDFYGGILVQSKNYNEVQDRLNTAKFELGITTELKWSKITTHYVGAYKMIVDEIFDLLEEDKAKIRIMFRQSAIQATNIPDHLKDSGFHLLYYQFIKHAFGIRYCNESDQDIYLRTYFDKLPDSKEKNELFKNHIYALQSLNHFKNANLKIRRDDIAEIDSKRHIQLQSIDIILGAIAFRLNDQHKIIPPGEKRRGKRTVAKEKVYKHINKRIREIYPGFNIGISTGRQGGITDFWHHPYRHWRFMPKEFTIDENKFK